MRGEKLRKKDEVEGREEKEGEKGTGKKMRKFVLQGLDELEQEMEEEEHKHQGPRKT